MTSAKQKIMDAVAMYRAIDELQPQGESRVNSDYDMGIKAAYSLNRTADYLDIPLKPLRALEEAYQKEIAELQQQLSELSGRKKEQVRKKIKTTQDSFEKDRLSILQQKEDITLHKLDLSNVSGKTRTPAFWVLDNLRDIWECEDAKDATYKMKIGDALGVRRAVQLYLYAPAPWEIDSIKQNNPDQEISANIRFPNNCGWDLASKLFWNAECIRKQVEPFVTEQENKKQELEKLNKNGEIPKAKVEEFERWVDEKLEEVIDFTGVRSISLDEFDDDLATPSGGVTGGLMPLLESSD